MKRSYYAYSENEVIEILAENYEDAIAYFEEHFDSEIYGFTSCEWDDNCKRWNPTDTIEI